MQAFHVDSKRCRAALIQSPTSEEGERSLCSPVRRLTSRRCISLSRCTPALELWMK